MKKVVVASKNPVKITAAEAGFKIMWPDETFEFLSVSAASGVSDQPLSDDETFTGATNRVQNAKAAEPEADYWVGLEGGVEAKGSDMEAFAWIIIHSKDSIEGKGRTGVFFLPPEIATLIHQGKELGEADDIVFGRTNSKQENGAVGLLTADNITRTSYYVQAVIFALIPFKNPELYA